MGAGHLKIGDQIKQADGTTGLVANVTTAQQTREMFNLTVSEAHTYYVGQDGWLVHNQTVRWPCSPVSTKWVSGNPEEHVLANHLEDLFPGKVYSVDVDQFRPHGDPATDFDIFMEGFTIEVKKDTATAKQILNQFKILQEAHYNGQYIVYAPKIQGSVERNLRNMGIRVIRDLGSLEKVLGK